MLLGRRGGRGLVGSGGKQKGIGERGVRGIEGGKESRWVVLLLVTAR